MFHGVFTALVTPFKDNAVDYESLGRLVDFQIDNGIQGLVVCGTTGESATLNDDEQFEILDFVIKRAKGSVPIIFGSGSNNTAATIEKSRKACEYDIDGLLIVVPYYNKPSQAGMIAHFQAVADAATKPVVLYNVPGRTVVSLEPQSIIELAKHPNICGIKEANADLNNFSMYKNQVGEDFCLLSGDDESAASFCMLGGHGVISVCSHIHPAGMVEWINQAREKVETARENYRAQHPWINSLYIEPNPIPTKYALHKKGVLSTFDVRLPLVPMSQQGQESLHLSFKDFPELLS